MNKQQLAALEETVRNKHGNIAGLVVLQNGQTAYEQYFNGYTAADPVHVFSVTKSIISILFGIAVGKGHIQSVNQPVLDFFPAYTKAGRKNHTEHHHKAPAYHDGAVQVPLGALHQVFHQR